MHDREAQVHALVGEHRKVVDVRAPLLRTVVYRGEIRRIIEEALQALKAVFLIDLVGGSASFNSVLTAVGYTQQDLEQVMRDDLRIVSYLSGRFPVARQPTAVEVVARQDLIDAWAASLINRANVIRVKP